MLPRLALLLICACVTAHSQAPQADTSELPRIPPTEPHEALETFSIRPGYRLELIAHEPNVMDPIAFDWDASGRLFVVEMRGYSERRDESLGRVRVLEDGDGDGFYETSHVFAEGLQWPTGICCARGGVYVVATPDLLYFKDTDGDLRADQRSVIFTGFSHGQDRLNVQALPNSLQWGLDGRIHGATSLNGARLRRPDQAESEALVLRGRDFSFDPNTHALRAEIGGGQYGMTLDDWGNKFLCSNSNHMRWVAYPEGERDLPTPVVDIPDDGAAAEVFRLSPDEPWRLVRTRWRLAGEVPGPVEGGGRVSGYFTSATGITHHQGELITADVGSNLVHHKTLDWSARVQPIARRLPDEANREMLASRDNWFRPCFLRTGPEGALYLADMYREVIEHPWSLPEGIKKHLDLNAGFDRGRIYRILPVDSARHMPTPLAQGSTSAWLATLESPISWERRTAARLLHENPTPEAIHGFRQHLHSPQPETRVLAVHALANHDAFTATDLITAMRDPDAWVRVAAIARSSPEELVSHMLKALADSDPRVRFRALLAFPKQASPSKDLLRQLAALAPQDSWCRAAWRRAMKPHAPSLVLAMATSTTTIPAPLLVIAAQTAPSAEAYGHLSPADQRLYLQAAAIAGQDIRSLLETKERTRLLDAHLARVHLRDHPIAERLESLEWIRALADEETTRSLLPLLAESSEDAFISPLIKLLVPLPSFDLPKALLDPWQAWSTPIQTEIIAHCLGRDPHILALFDRIDAGIIRRSALTTGQVASLQNHRNRTVALRARSLFVPKTKAERETAVIAARPALALAGDAAAGKQHYTVRCASCHEPNAEGKTLGPARKALSANGKERLLINLIDPNREVLPSYFASVALRHDGTSVSGILLSENAKSITIRQPLGVDITLPRSEISEILTEQHSAMPEGLEAGLSAQDLADLLAYVTDGLLEDKDRVP